MHACFMLIESWKDRKNFCRPEAFWGNFYWTWGQRFTVSSRPWPSSDNKHDATWWIPDTLQVHYTQPTHYQWKKPLITLRALITHLVHVRNATMCVYHKPVQNRKVQKWNGIHECSGTWKTGPARCLQGSKLRFFFQGAQLHLQKLAKGVLYLETSTSLGSLQKFEGDTGEFKGALGSWHSLILTPVSGCHLDTPNLINHHSGRALGPRYLWGIS